MIVHEVEQNSEEWFKLRAGIPTASEFSKIVTSEGKPSASFTKYAALLAAEAFAGRPLERWAGNQWSRRGHELEDDAREAYEFLHDREAVPVGFVTNEVVGGFPPNGKTAGASPDSLVDRDGTLEIKCLAPQEHVMALAYWHKHRRPPPEYVPQIQGQLLVCEREWVDLWFYHPALVCKAIRVHRDEAMQRALRIQCHAVTEERDRLLDIMRGI